MSILKRAFIRLVGSRALLFLGDRWYLIVGYGFSHAFQLRPHRSLTLDAETAGLIHAGLAVPAVRQVHGDVAAAVACDAGGDGDQLALDGRAMGSGEEGADQAARRRGSGYGRWLPGPATRRCPGSALMAG
jgi:hypothetical protein